MIQRVISFMLLILFSGHSVADEIRPGYLQLNESAPGVFSVVWKVPAKGDRKLGIDVQLPENCGHQDDVQEQFINNAYVKRWIASCTGGLVDREISITGLISTSTNVLIHIELNGGRSLSAHLSPGNATYHVPAESSAVEVASTYTWLGIEHILLGIDHLLFVFALLLIVRGWKRLVATITAFTLAHSITLAAATLGFLQVPQQPVEAVIALSILFLAWELAREKRGGLPGSASRWPWLIAFVFGLLHGFGFAGALAEVGLPQQSIPLALVFFNVGVEIGQLMFIGAMLFIGWLLHQLNWPKLQAIGEMVVIYCIGGLSSFWLIERVAAY